MGPSGTPTSPFQLTSPSSTNYTSTQIFEETNNLEVNIRTISEYGQNIFFVHMSSYGVMILQDTSRVFGGGDNESNNSEEPDPTPAVEMEDLNQGNGHINFTNKKVCCHFNASYALLVLLVFSIQD